jgi:hypothetical protein
MGKRNTEECHHQINMICLDERAPKYHLIRKIDGATDLTFIYDKVKDLYSSYGKKKA